MESEDLFLLSERARFEGRRAPVVPVALRVALGGGAAVGFAGGIAVEAAFGATHDVSLAWVAGAEVRGVERVERDDLLSFCLWRSSGRGDAVQ